MSAILTVNRVSRVFPGKGRPAVDDVSFELERGEFAFLIGHSGCGKSTLLRMIAGLLRPTSGNVVYRGALDPHRPRGGLWSVVAWYRYPVVYVEPRALLAQHRPSSDDETGLEWLMLVLSAYGKSRAIGQRVAPEVLELVGLGNKYDVPVRHLSGGEKQRLALATSIVNRPGVLLLDGPFDGLDPDTSVEIMRFLDRLNRAGTAVLCATHDDYIVNITRRRVIEQERGRIVRDQPHATYR